MARHILNLKKGECKKVIADTPPTGYIFDKWSGDTFALVDEYSSSTYITMPRCDVEVTALYKPICNLNARIIELSQTTTTTTTLTPTTTTTTTLGPALELTWDNINNAYLGYPARENVTQWNSLLQVSIYGGTPFTSVQNIGNTTYLRGGNNITLANLGNRTPDHLISVVDNSNCVISVANYCFKYAENLTTVNLPNLINVGEGAFSSCFNLLNVNFPNIKTIGNYGFEACYLLNTNFTKLISVGNHGFDLCTGLIDPDFSSLITAGDLAFHKCRGLVSPSFPSLLSAGTQCFCDYAVGYMNLTNINLPVITTLGDGCFSMCDKLQNIYLPLVTHIPTSCFSDCYGLKNVDISGCLQLGSTLNFDSVFGNLHPSAFKSDSWTITLPSALMTCNSGAPDGDIYYLQYWHSNVTIITV